MKSYRPFCALLSAVLMFSSASVTSAESESSDIIPESSHVLEAEVSSASEDGTLSSLDESESSISDDGEEPVIYEKADVSGDGSKDIEDVVLTIMHINGQRVLNEGACYAADFNDDGIIDIEDVVRMLENIIGSRSVEVKPDPFESSMAEESSVPDDSQAQYDESEPDESVAEPVDDLKELEKQVRDQVHGYDGNWSVYVKNLDTGATMVINNRPVYSASIIKLYAMGDAYEKIEQGKLNKDELSTYLRNMITVSDNNAFNYMVNLMGTSDMTAWCSEHGYTDTVVAHKLPNYYYDRPYNYGENKTTAVDAGKILEDIYKGELVSKDASAEMFGLLLDQQRRSKIPAGLPWGTKCGNKTGETDDYCHDAAIVCSGGANYVITVMVEYKYNAYSCNNNIANISRTVYNYFNH